jgi:hypothetical protein
MHITGKKESRLQILASLGEINNYNIFFNYKRRNDRVMLTVRCV